MEEGASVTEMVERVARAICLARGTCEYCRTACLATPEEFARSNKHAIARAALAAIREPTEAMKTAGRHGVTHGTGNYSEDAADIWRDMADEALK